jgi:hypothetical protein
VLPVKQKRTALPEVKWRKVEGGVPKSGVPESYVERFTFLADALGMDGKAMLEEQAKELYERMRRAARSELDGSLFNPPPVVRAMEKPKMKVTRAVRPEVDLGEAPPVTLPQAEYFHEDLETAGEAETAHQD